MTWDSLWLNANLATMAEGGARYGAVEDGALAVEDGVIAWVGARGALSGKPEKLAGEVHDAGGRWITPGLIDCHTHIVHAGHRAHEFEMRLEGASYEDIARAGGGIVSTVRQTRAASEAELESQSLPRLSELAEGGVTTVEIKSGYGLDVETELKQLRAARTAAAGAGLNVRTSFLGAHALPEDMSGDADGYIDFVCNESLPAAAQAGLADAVDCFCETIGFNVQQTERVFDAARKLGLPVKLHADQLSDGGGAALAAKYGALSADHLEHTSDAGIAAMAEAGTVAVLLPGAFYFLRETKQPPVEAFRRHGVPMAIATDSNPGSSPALSLLLMANMACTFFGLTVEEALAGITRNAAQALGMGAAHGTLEVGKAADFAVWAISEPAELAYAIGANPCVQVVRGGRIRPVSK
ncbi:MAG: imidazolonepropionase [Proteobacteria bacterium]|nr:imidazolonepropionase [Pseudomonadota bacterium]